MQLLNIAMRNLRIIALLLTAQYIYSYSGVARPGPTRACALPSTSQALPSPTQLESRDSTTNQTKVKKIHIYLAVLTTIDM